MACVLILRQKDQSVPDQYYLTGTGWVSTVAAATAYASKEAALPDGETLRESVGFTALLTVKDTTTGEEHPVPSFNLP